MSFVLYAEKNKLYRRSREPMTSGSVNTNAVRFQFSDDWEGLSKTALFRAGEAQIPLLLDDAGVCMIPWEVMAKPNVKLYAGVYGVLDGTVVLPTVWCELGTILPGAVVVSDENTPTPGLYEQILAFLRQKGDRLEYDGLRLSLLSGDTVLSTVEISASGGTGGTNDHRLLSGRDAVEQHPIGAITGLRGELDRIPSPAEPISNEELEELLK